jgi:hypothetical protein
MYEVRTETLTCPDGKVCVQGYVGEKVGNKLTEKIVYSSKRIRPGNLPGLLARRWVRRVKKQISGGRKFNFN